MRSRSSGRGSGIAGRPDPAVDCAAHGPRQGCNALGGDEAPAAASCARVPLGASSGPGGLNTAAPRTIRESVAGVRTPVCQTIRRRASVTYLPPPETAKLGPIGPLHAEAVCGPRPERGVGHVLFREAPWRGPGGQLWFGALFHARATEARRQRSLFLVAL